MPSRGTAKTTCRRRISAPGAWMRCRSAGESASESRPRVLDTQRPNSITGSLLQRLSAWSACSPRWAQTPSAESQDPEPRDHTPHRGEGSLSSVRQRPTEPGLRTESSSDTGKLTPSQANARSSQPVQRTPPRAPPTRPPPTPPRRRSRWRPAHHRLRRRHPLRRRSHQRRRARSSPRSSASRSRPGPASRPRRARCGL